MVEKPLFQEPGVKDSNSGSLPDLQCNFGCDTGISGLLFQHIIQGGGSWKATV